MKLVKDHSVREKGRKKDTVRQIYTWLIYLLEREREKESNWNQIKLETPESNDVDRCLCQRHPCEVHIIVRDENYQFYLNTL